MGKPICQHQAIQTKLGDMATRCEAARLLVESAASAYDRGERCDMEAGMAKLFASESALENATECMRIHGAYGYSKEFHVERYLRECMIHRLAPISPQLILSYLAEKALDLPKSY